MGVRRVVTGHDSAGKAVVVSDEDVPPGGRGPDSIWAADGPVTFPDDGERPEFAGPLIPNPGGFHIIRLAFPPHFNPDDWADTSDPIRAAASAREQMAAAVALVDDPNPPGAYGSPPGFTGLHATASMDCMMQVSGESVCVLEDTEIRLRPGDWLVLNGVVHAWRNDGDEPALLIGIVVGAEHKGVPVRREST